MSVKLASQRNLHDRPAALLRQRAMLLAADERRAELEARVKGYERQFGIGSDSIHAAIERGDLKETHEVCRWIIDYDLLRRTQTSEAR